MAKQRADIDDAYKWKTEDIYATEEDWEKDFTQVESLIKELEKKKGRIGSSAQELLETLELSNQMDRLTEKLFLYAKMRRDEDNTVSKYQVLTDRAEMLGIKASSAVSFMVPEIVKIPDESLNQYVDELFGLKLYQHFFAELRRQREHILSEAEERILAMSADLAAAAGNIFTMLNNADIHFPVITDENGQEVELTKGNFGRFMESSNREVRKNAFKGLYSSYADLKNTLAASLSANVKKDIFYARARKYPSALEASLDQDNVTVDVYNKLITTVHQHMDSMYRYMRLRKKTLGLEELHLYDVYVPLVQEFKRDIPYEEAQQIVLDGLKPLGDEYLTLLKDGMASGWIDVYENKGKTSGAYSWGSYDTHPYVLLNYDNKLDDVFTLAHEMGHSLHSHYSNRFQEYVYSQYTIFVAEVASTVNESLLMDYLLNNATDPREKLFLLNHYLEEFRGTVFRQTMFAEFEKIIHERVEQGGVLTPDELGEIYYDLNKLYYGPEVVLDDEIRLEYSRIPHFYSAFYVYKYATGFSAATAIKKRILQEGEPAVSRYINFLKSGSSDYPLNLLKKTGVDLTTPEPVDSALTYFEHLLDELEKLL